VVGAVGEGVLETGCGSGTLVQLQQRDAQKVEQIEVVMISNECLAAQVDGFLMVPRLIGGERSGKRGSVGAFWAGI
jgi:hypothetical protein